MIYAQIKNGVVVNCITIDNEDVVEIFKDGFDYIIRIDELSPRPEIGYLYTEQGGFVSNAITDPILLWDLSTELDWSRRRDIISPLFYAITGANMAGYGNLTQAQKEIGARYFLVPYQLRVSNGIVTEAKDKLNWDYLLYQTKISRIVCVEAMRVHAGQYMRLGKLTLAQTQQFFKDVAQFLKWFEEANLPDFKQWVLNEVGSIYENDGFKEKTYYKESLKDELYAIYNGNY